VVSEGERDAAAPGLLAHVGEGAACRAHECGRERTVGEDRDEGDADRSGDEDRVEAGGDPLPGGGGQHRMAMTTPRAQGNGNTRSTAKAMWTAHQANDGATTVRAAQSTMPVTQTVGHHVSPLTGTGAVGQAERYRTSQHGGAVRVQNVPVDVPHGAGKQEDHQRGQQSAVEARGRRKNSGAAVAHPERSDARAGVSGAVDVAGVQEGVSRGGRARAARGRRSRRAGCCRTCP